MNISITALKLKHGTPALQAPTSAQHARLVRWGAAVWQALEGVGRARARRELLLLADRWEAGRPELAAQLRAACREPANV